MAHVRVQIRDGIATALGAVALLAGRVNVNETDPAQMPHLPLVYVACDAESVERLTMGAGARMERKITCIIAVAAAPASDLDDTLESYATAIETVMVTPLSGLPALKDVLLQSMEKGRSGDGETDAGVLRLTYEITVHTAEGAPETMI